MDCFADVPAWTVPTSGAAAGGAGRGRNYGVLYEKGCCPIAEPRIAHIMAEDFHAPEQIPLVRFLPKRGEGKMYEFIQFGSGVHA